MIRYIFRRLLFFIPTLFAISILAFLISLNAPGDPVERIVSSSSHESAGTLYQDAGNDQKKYWRTKLGLDLPAFYFSLTSLSHPGFLYAISDKKEYTSLSRLAFESGNPHAVHDFYKARNHFIYITKTLQPANAPQISVSGLDSEILSLKYCNSIDDILIRLNNIRKFDMISDNLQLNNSLVELESKTNLLEVNSSRWKSYVPIIKFHRQNQYHRWLFGDGNMLTGDGAANSKGIIRGDFGLSYQTRQPVSEVIAEKAGWSLLLTLMAVILAYLVSIPVGIWAGANPNSKFDKTSGILLFALYSMPSFWVATMLLMVFANPDVLHLFPASGVKPPAGYPDHATLIDKIFLSLPYLVLPIISYTYSSFAFISRTTRVSVIEQMSQDYITTARAKGLPKKVVVFKHAFRNSLLPLITVFSSIFPRALGGSVILETIFTIPGMGFEIFQSVHNQNYPMIVAVFTISGALTVLGYLLADIGYAYADPRIKLQAGS